MSFGVNEVTLVGRIGAAPDFRFTPTGKQVANFSVATDESYRDKNNPDTFVDKTEWHNLSTFMDGWIDSLRRNACPGRLVAIRGKLATRKYTKEGEATPRYRTEIQIVPGGYIRYLDKRNGEANGGNGNAPVMPDDGDPSGDKIPF